MAQARKEDPIKYCKYCNELLTRKRYGSGRLEDFWSFNRRLYCNKEYERKDKINTSYNNSNWFNSHVTSRNISKLFMDVKCCEICGKEGKLDMHHKDGDYQNNNIDNLQALCRSCHNKIHRPAKQCIVCGDKHKGLGYCSKHYTQFKKIWRNKR